MNDSKSNQPPDAILYSDKLLGLRGECPVCGEWESSTGWLLQREGESARWYVDLICGGCGSRGGTWKLEWQSLIEEVLEAEAGR
jgi:hypothetical protein